MEFIMKAKNKISIISQIFLYSLTFFFINISSAEQIAIKAGFILDVKTGQLLINKNIIINEGQISEISESIPPGIKIIDLSDSYVLPGLIDMHTHIIGNLSNDYSSNLFQSPHRATIGGVVNAKKNTYGRFY